MLLKDQIKYIPNKPGVYFFKDKSDKILYIGKAKKIRARVNSYFNKNNSNIKNKALTAKASKIDYLVVRNEVEAIITEASMIKEYKPKYNVVLKDDKTFPYIIIRDELYPRLEIVRKKNLHKDNNIYFGPYSDVKYLRKVVKTLHQTLPIKGCNASIDEKFLLNNRRFKGRTCFCGFCMSSKIISKKQYAEIIDSVIAFLKGKSVSIVKQINKLMLGASKDLNFEEAARYRDSLKIIKEFIGKQKKISNNFSSYDIVHSSVKNNNGLGLVMRVRSGLLIGREKFEFKTDEFDFEKILRGFLIQYYSSTLDIPKEVVVNSPLSSKLLLKHWLESRRGKKISITFPKAGEKRSLLDLCISNTDSILENIIIGKIKRRTSSSKVLEELKDVLGMKVIPKRIEAFDNSNIQGDSAVAGMVCFIDGKPAKKKFRRFHIRTVKGIDDFKSMKEVAFRRYSRIKEEAKPLPDLILIDGGKGQLSAAKKSLDRLGLNNITVIGLAKKLEEVFIPSSSHPQNISKGSPALYLLRKIRDEAHRYAIEFHRQKRDKKLLDSNLRRIKGLGDKRYFDLFKAYKTREEISLQSPQKISSTTKIPIKICYQIVKRLKAK